MNNIGSIDGKIIDRRPLSDEDKRFLQCGFARTLGTDGPVKVKMIEPIPRIGPNDIESGE